MDCIDIVLTWVNGNDPEHVAKRASFGGQRSGDSDTAIKAGVDETRFVDNGELSFSLLSIAKFAPWVRKVFIVTDNQTPDISNEVESRLNIEIIDHQKIFQPFESCLPTFNSRAIETMLWRIPGLAEKFIYMNDDFIFASPAKPEDFFFKDSICVQGGWKPILISGRVEIFLEKSISKLYETIFNAPRTMHLLSQREGARLAGFQRRYFRVPHKPHPMLKSCFSDFFESDPKSLEKNIRFRFRSYKQFWPVSLATHLAISKGRARTKSCKRFIIINPPLDSFSTIKENVSKVREGKVDYICIGNFEKGSIEKQDYLKSELFDILKLHRDF